MKNLYSLLISLLLFTVKATAQTQSYGVVDTADLKMTSCSFEKDANAMVLFDKASIFFSLYGTAMQRHIRIKVLNEKGKDEGNVKIEYKNKFHTDYIVHLQAQTINLENGKIVISKLDPKLVYDQHTDKTNDAIVFSMPDVKAGSVIEYIYTWGRSVRSQPPTWYFQNDIPTRYSEFNAAFVNNFQFKALRRLTMNLLKDTIENQGHIWALANIPSAKLEPFMRSTTDYLESISLTLSTVNLNGKTTKVNDSWQETGKEIANDKDFYKAMDQKISDEDLILTKAKALKTDDEKIAFLFDEVKKNMKWNEISNWVSKDGIKSVWRGKIGTSGQINMVLYHLLKQSGIKVYPMLVSTRNNGRIVPGFVDIYQINSMIDYIPVDSTKFYVLDASYKYNNYNQIPNDYLNSYGLCLDKETNNYNMIFFKSASPVREVVLVNAEIGGDYKMRGTTEIDSYSYNRMSDLELYQTQGEKKFIDYLTEKDNNLKISSLKLKNTEDDTLPLRQSFDFTMELSNSDNYIYFNPNIFTSLHDNPFLEEKRNSPIDFGFISDHVISGKYKIPAGYKVESLPKTGVIVMPDKSIRFKRIIGEEEGLISLYYSINLKRSFFAKDEYSAIHAFYKKMYEMLNEQIVLKKL